jgi:molybdopterin molybdotransferase
MTAKTGIAIDDCFATSRNRLLHSEALNILKTRLPCIATSQTVPLEDATSRILAQVVTAPADVPSYDNSAVDGYAYCSADRDQRDGVFSISGRIAAGRTSVPPLIPGTAVRIFTGGAMPQGADTVAMQEDCKLADREADSVFIPSGLKPGANRRLSGEDLKKGQTLMSPGQILRPQELAAIASAGLAEIEVYSRLRVATLSSGDEIKRPGSILETGQLFDSNHYLLRGLLNAGNVDITDLGVLPDRAEAIEGALSQAAKNHDVIVTTGGASLGEEDHVTRALDRLGKRHLWQLAIKPGRPMCFGQIGSSFVFGLPGNPVAAFVCFLLYVRPSLLRLGGADWVEPDRFQVPSGFDLPNKKPGRREFWRAWLENAPDGTRQAMKFRRDGSGLVTGLRKATGLLEIPEDVEAVRTGDLLSFIPFTEFGIG